MITLKLNEADIDHIVEELSNANDAEHYYLNDQFYDVGPDEEKELNEAINARSKIIGKLVDAIRKGKRSKRK